LGRKYFPGSGIGTLMNRIEAGGAIEVGLGLVLTALICPGIYRTKKKEKNGFMKE
jgi:hypothetical protein